MNDLIGKIIAGRYHIETFLGKGGMAEVYKVWDEERSVSLAMKILHGDLAEDKVFLRRFKREAQTLAKLQHPNIVRFYGLEQADDLVYMLMDYVEGTTLRKEIFQAKRPLSMERIIELMKPICSALYYAHKSGFVHCDMKPANIMIHKNGTVYVTDFGIARMTEASTSTMIGAGTPAYMAPEQARGEDPLPQTDIYALGIVLFEMLTGGERPFTGESAKTTGSTSEKVRWEQIRLAAPPPSKYNPSIPKEIDAIVLKCLDKTPSNRYLSATDLFGDLVIQANEPFALKSRSIPTGATPLKSQPEAQSKELAVPAKPIPENTSATKNLDIASSGGNRTPRSFRTAGIFGAIILVIGLIIFGSLGATYQSNMNATSTQDAKNLQATGTKEAKNSQATNTKQIQNIQSTATKQAKNAQATSTKQAQNARATVSANLALDMVPNDVLSDFPKVSFFDTFDQNTNGWSLLNSYTDIFSGNLKILSGKYIHTVETVKINGYILTEDLPKTPTIKNFYFQADILRVNGSGAWSCYGLRFRDTGESAYHLEVCDDRFYELTAYIKDTGWVTIIAWTHSSKIISGETNRVGVVVKDQKIDIYINGIKIRSLESSYILSAGKQGLIKSLYSKDPVVFEYDNVIVLTP